MIGRRSEVATRTVSAYAYDLNVHIEVMSSDRNPTLGHFSPEILFDPSG